MFLNNEENMKTQILVTFATEDPITPGHDEIIMELCSGLSARGIPGGFHLTGDYVRSLRKRNRKDVISALKEHETGYHTNTHASYPFAGTFGETLSWDEAVARYMHTEAKGIEDIVETLGVFPAYVVSEFLKVPQLAEAYRKLGLRYAGLNSGMPDSDTSAVCCSGMYAYAGPLFGMERAPFEGRLAEGLSELRELLEKHPPAIKIFMHPYKLLYNSPVQAWYGKNNFYRYYDPAAKWEPPVISRYTPEVVKLLTDEFFALFDLVMEYDVEFVTTAAHLSQYVRPAGLTVSRNEVESLWNTFKQKQTYLCGFTPAEITAMKCFSLRYPDAHEIPVRTVGGPADTLIPDPACSVKDADIFFEYSGRMPDRITPELFVCDLPESAKDELEYRLTEWTRDIYPADFTGKEICRLSTLQSWGFRPSEKIVQGE